MKYLNGLFFDDKSVKSLNTGGSNPKLRRRQYSQNLENEFYELNKYLNMGCPTNKSLHRKKDISFNVTVSGKESLNVDRYSYLGLSNQPKSGFNNSGSRSNL